MRAWHYDDELFVLQLSELILHQRDWRISPQTDTILLRSDGSRGTRISERYSLEYWRYATRRFVRTQFSVRDYWSRLDSELTIRTEIECAIDSFGDLRKGSRVPFATDSLIRKGARCLFWRLGVDERCACSENMKNNDISGTDSIKRSI